MFILLSDFTYVFTYTKYTVVYVNTYAKLDGFLLNKI